MVWSGLWVCLSFFISNTNHRKSLSLSSYDPEIPLKTGGWARFRLRWCKVVRFAMSVTFSERSATCKEQSSNQHRQFHRSFSNRIINNHANLPYRLSLNKLCMHDSTHHQIIELYTFFQQKSTFSQCLCSAHKRMRKLKWTYDNTYLLSFYMYKSMFPSAKYAYQTVGCHFIVEMFVFVYDIKYLLMIMLIRFKQIVATNNFKNNCGAPSFL